MSAVLKSVPKKRNRIVSVNTQVNVGYVDVDCDVDLADIDIDDLRAELDERNGSTSLLEIYELMAAGKREVAYEAMRTYLQDVLGRVLP